MKRTEINSAAFKAAALQSEKHRVAGILWILVACVQGVCMPRALSQ